MAKNDIIRYAGETAPTKTTIKINGSAIDINGWDIEVHYKIPIGTLLPDRKFNATAETEMVIDCIITDAKEGKVNIYPHARQRYLPDGTTESAKLAYKDYITPEVYKALYDADIAAGGDGSTVPAINQVWDEDEVGLAGVNYPFYIVRKKRYATTNTLDGYLEEQIHNTGLAIISSRWVK